MSEKQQRRYTCEVCQYQTHFYGNMVKHLKKVLPCGNVSHDHPAYVRMIDRFIHHKKPLKESGCVCDTCGKRFKCATSIYRHRKTCTGVTKTNDVVAKLEQRVRELENKAACNNSNTTYNNCTITNNTQNIIINGFGHEGLERVLNNVPLLDSCLKRKDKGQAELIEYIHFRIPENRNVCYSNRRNMIRVFEDGEWGHQDKDDVQELMIDRSNRMLTEHLHTNRTRIKKQLSDSWFNDVVEYAEKIKEKDFDTIVRLKDRLEEIRSRAKVLKEEGGGGGVFQIR